RGVGEGLRISLCMQHLQHMATYAQGPVVESVPMLPLFDDSQRFSLGMTGRDVLEGFVLVDFIAVKALVVLHLGKGQQQCSFLAVEEVHHLCARVARCGLEYTCHDQRQGEDDYLQDRRFPRTHTQPSPRHCRPSKVSACFKSLWTLDAHGCNGSAARPNCRGSRR